MINPQTSICAPVFAVLLLLGLPTAAQEAASPTPYDPEAIEAIRPEVEAILAQLYDPERLEDADFLFARISDRLIALGPAVGAFMAEELEASSPASFNIAAYVMAHSGDPNAQRVLRRAVARAESNGGKFGKACKEWAIYGLAITGDEQALFLLDQGLQIAGREISPGLSLSTLATLLAQPGTVPVLLAQLDRAVKREMPEGDQEEIDAVAKDQARTIERILVTLKYLADPATREAVEPLLDFPVPAVRVAAAEVLGGLRDVALFPVLYAALDDENPHARRRIADAMRPIAGSDAVKPLLARLETEEDAGARRGLYRALSATGSALAVEGLANHWGRPNPDDRMWLQWSVGEIRSPKAINLLRAGLRDKNNGVALQSVSALAYLGTPAARDALLAALRSPQWPVVSATVEELVRIGEARAAPRIADLLIRGEVQDPTGRVDQRTRVRRLGDALISLSYPDGVDDIKAALDSQLDIDIRTYLEQLVVLMSAMRANGERVEAWSELLATENPELRALAAQRLGQIGGTQATQALAARFAIADTEQRLELMEAVSVAASPAATGLITHVLIDAEFDSFDLRDVREMAAWAARRVGGKEMIEALRRSVIRRQGREYLVLVYLAVLQGEQALPLIDEMTVPRLRFTYPSRGREQLRLAWIAQQWAMDRTLVTLDQPPVMISLGH